MAGHRCWRVSGVFHRAGVLADCRTGQRLGLRLVMREHVDDRGCHRRHGQLRLQPPGFQHEVRAIEREVFRQLIGTYRDVAAQKWMLSVYGLVGLLK